MLNVGCRGKASVMGGGDFHCRMRIFTLPHKLLCVLGEVFHHGEWRTHGFGHVVAYPSEAPVQLHRQSHELAKDDCGKEHTRVILLNMVFNKIGKGGSWEESQIGTARSADFFAYVEQKGVFFLHGGNSQVQPLLPPSPLKWEGR